MPVKTPGQIQKWTCHKLECFSDFIDSYARATRKTSYCYLELFSGISSSPCNGTDCFLEGTALRALKGRSKFISYAFLAPNRSTTENLKKLIPTFSISDKIQVVTGSPNSDRSLCRLLDNVPRSASSLIFIDPGGYRRLDWSSIEMLTVHGKNWRGEKPELLVVFPLEMALLRNLMRSECRESITRFYGNQNWEDLKRQKQVKKPEPTDFRYRLVELYKNRLFDLGYHYVEDYKPASPTHDPYYHLIYAGDSVSRLNDIREAWGKVRFLRCELLYGINKKSRSKLKTNH